MKKEKFNLDEYPRNLGEFDDSHFRIWGEFTYPVEWRGRRIGEIARRMVERVCQRAEMSFRAEKVKASFPEGLGSGRPRGAVRFTLVSKKTYRHSEAQYMAAKNRYLEILHEERDALDLHGPVLLSFQFASPWAFVRGVNELRQRKAAQRREALRAE